MNLTLPYPPSVNTYWRHDRGRTHISTKGKQYRIDVVAAVLSTTRGSRKFLGPVRVTIVACAPDKRRRDLDNLLKATLDSMQAAGVYDDDSQVHEINMRWGERVKDGALMVQVVGI